MKENEEKKLELNKKLAKKISEEELKNLEMLNVRGGLSATPPSFGCPKPTTTKPPPAA